MEGLGVSQVHGHGSWLVCEVALSFEGTLFSWNGKCEA